MGRTACVEPQCLYKGALYLTLSFTAVLSFLLLCCCCMLSIDELHVSFGATRHIFDIIVFFY